MSGLEGSALLCSALQFLFLFFSPVKSLGWLVSELPVHGSDPSLVIENAVRKTMAGATSVRRQLLAGPHPARGLCLVGFSFLPFLGLIWEAEEGAFVKARLGAPGEEKRLPTGRHARGSPRNPSFGQPNSVPVHERERERERSTLLIYLHLLVSQNTVPKATRREDFYLKCKMQQRSQSEPEEKGPSANQTLNCKRRRGATP